MEASNDLFGIQQIIHEYGHINATLTINKNSEILKGHFPGQPVIPGACMLQLVKEVLESALEYPIRLKKAGSLKFMNMIDPTNTEKVQLEITHKLAEDNSITTTAQLNNDVTVYFKLQGSFIKV